MARKLILPHAFANGPPPAIGGTLDRVHD